MDDRTTSFITLIRGIQQRSISPRSLSPEDRRHCIEHLTADGYSALEIAEILQVSERTVARDRAEIRQANAVSREPKLTGEMVGQLVQQAEQCIGRIRRITRDRQVNPQTRVDGERACWLITRELIERLQSLGYLPTSPTEIRGELTHHHEALPPFSEMQEEVARLEAILDQADGGDQELSDQLAAVKDLVLRGAAHEGIVALASTIDGEQEHET